MGYYTQFTLKIIPESEGIMAELRTEESSAKYAFDEYGECEESCKGYGLPEEVSEIAKQYPNHIFLLEGVGEETEDVWKHYFKGDQEKRIEAKLVFADPPSIFETNEGQKKAAYEEDLGLVEKQQQKISEAAAKDKKEKIDSLKAQLKDLEK